MNIRGFGTFDQAKIKSAAAQRASGAQLEKLTFTCPTAAELGIAADEKGVAVVVHLRVNSLRQASESAIDFIKRGRPMILEIRVDGGMSAANVATVVKAAFDQYSLKFLNMTLPVTITLNSTDITVEATQGYFQINDNVSFLKRGDIFALNAVTTRSYDSGVTVADAAIAPGDTTAILSAVTGLTVGDTIEFNTNKLVDFKITEIVTSTKTITFTPALGNPVEATTADKVWKVQKSVEAINDGKYLEENVRMSTNFTADSYAINPGQVPVIGAKYTMISWTSDPLNTVGGWQPHKSIDVKSIEYDTNTFTLYFNEDTCLSATGPVKYLLDWLDVSANVALTNFKKANGASAESVADFYA